MKNIIDQILSSIQEKQGASKRLLIIEELEQETIKVLGSVATYEEQGGFKKLVDVVMELRRTGRLKDLTNPELNWKRKPQLHQSYWLLPKYDKNIWNKTDIAKIMTYIDIGFYLRNKKYQTENEWNMLLLLYEFLKKPGKHIMISREERSSMLFKNVQLPDGIEPEKYLGSTHGQRLLSRLHLTPEDLHFKVVREPFHYWENIHVPHHHVNEVLIVEGLSTYDTVKQLLSRQLWWELGPIPRVIIWGEGYRICSTLDYLHEIAEDPTQLVIRYAGDVDYEGFNIYFDLKEKYKELNLSLSLPFYSFLIDNIEEFATNVITKQRIVENHLFLLEQEFRHAPKIYEGVKHLWNHKKRIAQECMNMESILLKGEG